MPDVSAYQIAHAHSANAKAKLNIQLATYNFTIQRWIADYWSF